MPQPGLGEARILLARHPDHSSAVTATLNGPESSRRLAHISLTSRGFRSVDPHTLVLARIDHDEPYYANQAAQALREVGATVEITPALQEEIDTEWTYGNYPMPYLDRDDITEGRLTIHAHAHDGWTTVAVGTYQDGKSVHFHGEDYLRQETMDFDNETEAVADFHRHYSVAVRPGPAPLTDIERAATEALTTLPVKSPAPGPAPSTAPSEAAPERVPVYSAGPRDHEALLADFFAKYPEWGKWRPHDETTIASHESLTLRVEFLHEPRHGDNAWTIAAYESPVGERIWHATATPTTPVESMRGLLDSLSTEDNWGQGLPTPVTDEDLAQASRPLEDIGWPLKVGPRLIDWAAPTPDLAAGLRFDTSANQGGTQPAWTVWSGNTAESPGWAIRLSTHAPAQLVQDIVFELAHGQSYEHLRPATATAPGLSAQASVVRPSATAPRAAHKR